MEKELLALLPDLKNAIATGVSYASDLFNRAVEYYKMVSQFQIGICLVLFLGFLIFSIWLCFWLTKEEEWDGIGPLIMIPLFALIVSGGFLISGVLDLIKLNTIPEVFILNEITNINN